MSVAYNTSQPLRSLRKAIASVGGTWTFRFFDRTPDALFGDDVKQRTSIVFRDSCGARPVVQTSGLVRWTSRQRSQLFSRLPNPVELPHANIAGGIPKVGTDWELAVLERLRWRAGRWSSLASTTKRGDAAGVRLAIGATAYNYIALYRDALSPDVSVATNVMGVDAPSEADALYAYLASDLVYWLWRVEGDGFHVPMSWLLSLPAVPGDVAGREELAQLGRHLWLLAMQNPAVALNGGRRTVSYRPPPGEVVSRIDRRLASAFALEDAVPGLLARFRAETISVGRMTSA
jgi:hypothetical protein